MSFDSDPISPGVAVDVWWEGDACTYQGTVTNYNVENDTYAIAYADGDNERGVAPRLVRPLTSGDAFDPEHSRRRRMRAARRTSAAADGVLERRPSPVAEIIVTAATLGGGVLFLLFGGSFRFAGMPEGDHMHKPDDDDDNDDFPTWVVPLFVTCVVVGLGAYAAMARRGGVSRAILRKLARQPNLWLAFVFAVLVAVIHALTPATPLSPCIGLMVPILTAGVVFLDAVRFKSRFFVLFCGSAYIVMGLKEIVTVSKDGNAVFMTIFGNKFLKHNTLRGLNAQIACLLVNGLVTLFRDKKQAKLMFVRKPVARRDVQRAEKRRRLRQLGAGTPRPLAHPGAGATSGGGVVIPAASSRAAAGAAAATEQHERGEGADGDGEKRRRRSTSLQRRATELQRQPTEEM